MVDPITLAALGSVALSEGVKFLYAQAGELLKQRRERKAAAAQLPAEVFEPPAGPLQPDLERAEALESELRQLRRELSEYGQGIDEVAPADTSTVEMVDALRRSLEVVYGQPIVFKGERRPAGDVQLAGEVVVQQVRGYVAGVRARRVGSGSVRGTARATSVEQGGQAVGVDVGDVC